MSCLMEINDIRSLFFVLVLNGCFDEFDNSPYEGGESMILEATMILWSQNKLEEKTVATHSTVLATCTTAARFIHGSYSMN